MVVAPVTVTGLVLGAGQAAARCAGVAAALHMIERIASRRARVNGSSRAVTGSPLTSRIPPRDRTVMPPAPGGGAAACKAPWPVIRRAWQAASQAYIS